MGQVSDCGNGSVARHHRAPTWYLTMCSISHPSTIAMDGRLGEGRIKSYFFMHSSSWGCRGFLPHHPATRGVQTPGERRMKREERSVKRNEGHCDSWPCAALYRFSCTASTRWRIQRTVPSLTRRTLLSRSSENANTTSNIWINVCWGENSKENR